MRIFAIHDAKVSAFRHPQFNQFAGDAIRGFQLAAQNEATDLSKFPADYRLYEIGTLNEESGIITPHATPVYLATASDYVSMVKASLEVVQ